MPLCKLCMEEKQLVKKSHIIPDCMYRNFSDEHNSYVEVLPEELLDQNSLSRRRRSGIYEGDILCKNCETIISKFESYGCPILYSEGTLNPKIAINAKHFTTNKGKTFSTLENLDYTKFKLFLLSIIWRCSISNRVEFASVKLSPGHEETLRQMILTGDAKSIRDYPIIFSYLKNDLKSSEILIPPHKVRRDYFNTYRFVITRFIFDFYITEGKSIMNSLEEATLKPSGSVLIFHFDTKDYIKDLILAKGKNS